MYIDMGIINNDYGSDIRYYKRNRNKIEKIAYVGPVINGNLTRFISGYIWYLMKKHYILKSVLPEEHRDLLSDTYDELYMLIINPIEEPLIVYEDLQVIEDTINGIATEFQVVIDEDNL